MFRIQCPRCEQFWFSDDEDEGRVRLCADCVHALKRKQRGPGIPFDAFMAVAAVLLLVDVAFILLTRFWPDLFGMAMLIYGFVLLLPGLVGLRRVVGYQHAGDANWMLGRWPLMFALMGLACVMAYFSFVIMRRQT